jgi:hypothetical protein
MGIYEHYYQIVPSVYIQMQRYFEIKETPKDKTRKVTRKVPVARLNIENYIGKNIDFKV